MRQSYLFDLIVQMRDNNAVIITELVKDVLESIVANTNYGTSMRVQKEIMGNLIQRSLV